MNEQRCKKPSWRERAHEQTYKRRTRKNISVERGREQWEKREEREVEIRIV